MRDLSMRDLYQKIMEYNGELLFEKVIKQWLGNSDYRDYLVELGSRFVTEVAVNLTQNENWELYALSRVLDALTLRFQPDNNRDESKLPEPELLLSQYVLFSNLIGLETFTPKSFHTFDCEIIEAIEGTNDFEIVECFFPAVKLNNIMIKRAGVRITLNPVHFDLTLVNNAEIYWAFRRKNRAHSDLSHGWGSNSQWRMDLRLDIETKDSFIYNQNGTLDLNHLTSEVSDALSTMQLDLAEAIELTKFRHLIHSIKGGLFPYDFRYVEGKDLYELREEELQQNKGS